jgi:hypothetical protein
MNYAQSGTIQKYMKQKLRKSEKKENYLGTVEMKPRRKWLLQRSSKI